MIVEEIKIMELLISLIHDKKENHGEIWEKWGMLKTTEEYRSLLGELKEGLVFFFLGGGMGIS